jgi:putative spermidine/putrescine transport system permease protein
VERVRRGLIPASLAPGNAAERRSTRRRPRPATAAPAWWQAAPFTLVFVLFFVMPLALVLMVSFWDFNEYELLPGSRSRTTSRSSRAAADLGDLCTTLQDLPVDAEVLPAGLGDHAGARLRDRLLPGLPRPLAGMQTVLFVLCTIPFWTSNVIRMISWVPLLGRNGLVNQACRGRAGRHAAGVAAVLGLLGGAGVRAPVHACS